MIDHDDAPPQCIAVKPPLVTWPGACEVCADAPYCKGSLEFPACIPFPACVPFAGRGRKDGEFIVFAERTTFEEI